jgi:glutamate-1-semialdehyde 2,1-aminomutase
VIPDLTTLAKILAGGLPGGAVAGKKDILDLLEFKDREWNRYKKIAHPGTYNANPLSAAAGVAALRIIASGEENKKADKIAQHLRSELNRIIDKHQVPWKAYGDFSGIHFLFHYEEDKNIPFDPENFQYDYRKMKGGGNPDLFHAFRCAMVLNGIDVTTSTLTSSAHTLEDVERTAKAFDQVIAMLKDEGMISG